jgi:carbon storage regulator CsrA|tara:strand:+ start:567 stop:749 length:183 start_codon:yes stop_codon:yes gene_type:complete
MSRLVLTRKTNESVVIHKDNDTVVVLNVNRIDRNQVRLSFEADTDVKIDRSEVFFQDENN